MRHGEGVLFTRTERCIVCGAVTPGYQTGHVKTYDEQAILATFCNDECRASAQECECGGSGCFGAWRKDMGAVAEVD